jgi:hypothetical protein
VKKDISIVQALERLLTKWEVLFNAVNAFTKLSADFDNDFNYNLGRRVVQIRENKATVTVYLKLASDAWCARDDRYAFWEKAFKKRHDTREELLGEAKAFFKGVIERFNTYCDAMDVVRRFFPAEEVEHLFKATCAKYKDRLEDALKTFGFTVDECLAWEAKPVKVDLPAVDFDDEL